jgi:hypothetical protein
MNNKQTEQPQGAVMKIKKDYLSVDDLRPMTVGQEVEFVMRPEKLPSAKSTCNNMKYQGRLYSTSIHIDMDGGESSITVKRLR